MFAPFNAGGANEILPLNRRRVVNRGGATAVAIGDLMCFDLTAGETETAAGQGVNGLTGLNVNDALWQNVINPTAPSGVLTNAYCVVTSLLTGAGADNTDIEVAVSGIITAAVQGTNFTAPGAALMPGTTASLRQMLTLADAAGTRAIGKIVTATDASSAEKLTTVMFYGLGGLFGGGNT